MIHEPDLIEQIQKLPIRSFDGTVFRATGMNANPKAFSTSGGRWSPPDVETGLTSILYTSMEANGAIAEVASYLSLLTPIPQKPIRLHTLEVAVDRALKIVFADFKQLNIDPNKYKLRNYTQTRRVGAAADFLGFDGLIVPSTRWQCDNLVIFGNKANAKSKLIVLAARNIPFEEWIKLARAA